MAVNEIDDYWTMQVGSTPERPKESPLKISTITGVEPLDAQLGVLVPKTVPDALYGPILGPRATTDSERAAAGSYPDQMSTLHTYAILDAAKVPNLPELLADSGLEHRCLFKGASFDELKDVAPWVVRLEDNNTFSRNLFTLSDAPWHLWDNKAGIYLRASGSLKEIWKHFRKFTRVQDENDKWYYYRFWEPQNYFDPTAYHIETMLKTFGLTR